MLAAKLPGGGGKRRRNVDISRQPANQRLIAKRDARNGAPRRPAHTDPARAGAQAARGARVVEYLNSRRMNAKAKEYEYEVAWVGQSQRENTWMLRSVLCREKMGLSKLVEDMDARISMYRMYRQLTTPLVLSHLKEFGLEESVATATKIRGLSGGQKVKLVLGAAMWVHPHVLVRKRLH